ncbi:calycin-like domain-containing protein [Prevotella sp.]|uniref:calycin-like domain-containing protein n=1 Tax=Prevotella sp. TaxID=59823 RepID=UPI0025FDD47B|nr:calycin-like domain-containing protein [Prevotella sp.]
MKKILSLLSMLMITVMAFAGSYSDALHFEVNLMGAKAVDLPNGTLTIEKRVDGTYNVTAEGCDFTQYEMGNWGELVCEEVAGTTDASGLTTIEVSNPYCYLTQSSYALSDSKLVVKFNDTKAYATFNGQLALNALKKYPFQYTFGTDDFGSTGGGGTVETTEGPLVEAGLTPNGARIEAKPFTINWDTHKVVAKLDMTTCQGVNENALSFSNNAANLAEWNTSNGASLHFYYTKDAYVWNGTANVQLTNTFTIQFRNSDDLSTTPTKYVQVNDPSNVRVELRQDGVYIDGTLAFEASDYAKLLTYNDLVFGSTQGDNRSNATYKYVEVVGLDWTEPATVVASKEYTDKLFMTMAGGQPSELGTSTVTVKEMSDGTYNMSLVIGENTVEAENVVKGTDEKDRTTYACTFNMGEQEYQVNAVVYTNDNNEEKIYLTATTTGATFTVGSDPDYVAPAEPEDVTLWEKYQADGNGFSKTATIDWDKQKIVASIDFSNGGDDKDILAMTTGESFAAFQTSTYRTMHWYCNQSVKQMSGFFAKSGAGNNNTGRFDVADCLAKFEISKAEGLKVNGVVKMTPEALEELFASNTVLIGSGESPKFSQAFYNYIKVVSLDWTEPTTPETPEAVVYKNTLKVVRNNETQTYEEAEVKVLAKEEGKYEVTIPAFSDMDGVPGQVGPVTFEATGTESEGNTVLTAENQEFTLTNVGWNNDVVVVSMNGTIADGQLTGTFNVAFKNNASYTFNLYYGVEPPVEITEVSNKDYTSNLRIYDSESESEENLFQADEATVNVVKYSDESYKITLKQITLNEQTADLVFTGTEQRATPYEEGGTVETVETLIVAKPDAATEAFLGGEGEEIGATFQIVNVSENEIKMALNISGNTFMYDGEFNYDQPEEPKEDYAINFEKDAKQTHASRYSTSVSLTVNGQAQTIEFGKTMNGYEDLTAQSFTVTPGAEVTPAIGYVGEWMHGYVYVDLNNDKQFSFNADSDDQTGTEVVSYSFYSASNGSTGLNSKGETVSNNCNVNPLPSFTAPAEEGTYRIRFKVDWNSIDAGGCVVSGNNILNNGGGIYDATLVVKDTTNGIDSINAEAANAELFTVDGVKISKLQKGLNIVRTADGKVKKVVIK